MASSDIPRWQDKYQEYDRMFSPMKCAQDEIDDLRAELVRIEEHGTPWVPELLEWLEKHECCPELPFTDYELIEALESRFGAKSDAHETDDFVDRVLSLADVHAEDSREDGARLMSRGALVAFSRDLMAGRNDND